MFADPKPVAAVVTEYRENSHGDLILGRILEGYNFQGKDKPNLKLVSLYTDQVPSNDWSRLVAKKHDVLICETIEAAVTLGTSDVPVEGVILIGENGAYPSNAKGQTLHPRRQFFEKTTDAFAKVGRVVPVFNDTRLAANWNDAKWMCDRAAELTVPLMAGSVMPLTWRDPAVNLPMGCRIAEVVAVGYGDIETSGFYALEMLQCMVERRRGGESGVFQVRYVEGIDVWRVLGLTERLLLNSALECCPNTKSGSPRDNCGEAAAAFVIDYCDRTRAVVLMLTGHVQHFSFAARLRGTVPSVVACRFHLQQARPYNHFACQVKAIERMISTGQTPYPVDRTLLTTGMHEALMASRHERRPVDTPHLALSYRPVDCAFATGPIPS
jgi:hypothetical protein